MGGNQAGKSNPASKRMMCAAKKAEYDDIMQLTNPLVKKRLLESFADGADYVHHKCDICHSRRNHHVPKKEAPYTYDFGKWMAKQQGTPGALEQERITGRTIHYINEHPRATEAQIKAAVILDREAAEAL